MTQSAIKPFRRHVFVCVNSRDGRSACEDHGAKEALAKVKEALKALPFAKRDGVRLSQSGCLGQCEHGPVAVVYPGGKWISYSSTDELIRFVLEAIEAPD
ncbi:MAG: (2Fe-2S) ferredoxin domain-containing protein [Methylocystis sp.]|nr:(2Fe-2S) ferredoxin domain-containing protein [Methylocystis sp.]MBI5313378.1 (2Fe-2S) ferredoxin domain-containing protein [Methylocystis sp.]